MRFFLGSSTVCARTEQKIEEKLKDGFEKVRWRT